MMMSDLPPELLEEILSRVPATCLKRVRSTCKRWNNMFKDRRFTEKHLRKAGKESLILMLKELKLCSIGVNLNSSPPSVEFQGTLDLKDSHPNSEQVLGITEVFHCDGLLLCTTMDNRIVVWNPCLGETRWIQRKNGYERYSRFALGYENNKSCRSYKILMCWVCYNRKLEDEDGVLGFEIYEFSSDSWRVLDDVASDCFPSANGVSLMGNAYWLKEELLIFDFTIERFKRVCLPPVPSPDCMALSVVREEQLSLLHRIQYTSKMEIYVTKKVDTEEADLLWSKSSTVNLPIGGNKVLNVFSSLLIDEEKKVALHCNFDLKTRCNMLHTIEEKYIDILYTESIHKRRWLDKACKVTYKLWWWPFIFNYVPSLVQIKNGRGRKRKERN
ncbi:F-box-like domain superfamily [Arabidopsis suecica]|uniref:F-box-like domain superfamily n=1 Tax=Arabidopsis suecica TaxID=45249 RepID=A0A8T2BG64_ARASU|nr:F-box-like domain superfamily [Arabidopsis suecica]